MVQNLHCPIHRLTSSDENEQKLDMAGLNFSGIIPNYGDRIRSDATPEGLWNGVYII